MKRFLVPFLALLLLPPVAAAGSFDQVRALLSPSDSALVVAEDGEVLFSWKPDAPRVPASILKILTSLAALKHWGPKHRFATEVYVDLEDSCAIKGFGDPLLVSEVLEKMAAEVAEKAPGIRRLIVDGSYFDEGVEIPGTGTSENPYDAPAGALCANFNTVFFTRDPDTGEPVSAEVQTPLIPFSLELIRQNEVSTGRVLLARERGQAALYAGHLFAWFYQWTGGGKVRDVRTGRVPASFMLLKRFESPFDLSENVRRLLKYSNNYMANQILLALGAEKYGPPATLEKGVRALSTFARQELGLEDFTLVEGSGISRENRITAREMMRVLEAFAPYMDLLDQDAGVFLKTGTLNGIRTRAGYVRRDWREPCSFVIMLNTPGADPYGVMEWVLRALPPREPG
ncbi:MAG: D-alanyl-D-alanine carboxypeptidase [Deltaproteobacteria bacterium]|nr:D-alanyl-D-alanine carboxypeptidase [Deltaproteobacteria bacterium]